jgi:DNA segregation ATPase FtsK/SpoIIIE-like protein
MGPYTLTIEQFKEAATLVVGSQFGSVPMLQRRMQLGFLCAEQAMERLEGLGVVGPRRPGGSARDVLVPCDALPEVLALIDKRQGE